MDTELTSLTPFEMIIPVEQEHIDQLNHVGNLIYVKWIQEAAINHWMTCAEPHLTETIAFVIARHEIDYKYSAKLGDTVVVKTWVGKPASTFLKDTPLSTGNPTPACS